MSLPSLLQDHNVPRQTEPDQPPVRGTAQAEAGAANQEQPPSAERVVKRYSNRKLYDTESSRYITLLQIAELIMAGENVRVVNNRTREDKTEATLVQVIAEQFKTQVPPGAEQALKRIICGNGGSGLLPQSESPVGLSTGIAPDPREQDSVPADTAHMAAWQLAIESKLEHLPPAEASVLRARVRDLNERLVELQHRVTPTKA